MTSRITISALYASPKLSKIGLVTRDRNFYKKLKVLGFLGQRLIIESPKNETLINRLKLLPKRDRAWDPKARVWEVSPRHYHYVRELVKEIASIEGYEVMDYISSDYVAGGAELRTRQDRLMTLARLTFGNEIAMDVARGDVDPLAVIRAFIWKGGDIEAI